MTDQTTDPGAPSSGPPPATGASDAPPRQPGRGARPVLRRSSTDKVVAGVAGGLARTFGQDPVVMRVLTVVVVLAFPPAFVAYLAAWLLVARDDEPSRPPSGGIAFREAGGVGYWVGAVVLAGMLLTTLDDPFSGLGGGFGLFPLVLIGIGIALWTRDGDTGSGATTSAATSAATGAGVAPAATATPPAAGVPGDPATTTTTTGDVMSTTTEQAAAPGGAVSAPPSEPPVARRTTPGPLPAGPPPAPRPRSPLGAVTIAVALIVTGVVAALDQVDGVPIDADPSHLAAVALLVLGLGQLVGAVWGRARWLSLVAVFLLPPVLFGAVVRGIDSDLDLDGLTLGDGIGERVLRPGAGDDLPEDVDLLAGSVTVDLEDWRPDAAARSELAGDEDLSVDVGAGEVLLTVPRDVPWRVVGEVRLGEIEVRDQTGIVSRRDSDGDSGTALDVELAGGPQDGEVLDIVVDVRLGQLTITTLDDPQELS